MAKRRKTQENQFLRSLDGLAYGLFVSVVIGAFLNFLAELLDISILATWGSIVSSLAGPAVGIGVAYATGASGIVLLSAALAGAICMGDGAAWPICAYLAVMVSCYIGHFCHDKTPVDIFLVPTLTIITAGFIAEFVAPYVNIGVNWFISQVSLALGLPLWLMGIVVAMLMGFLSVTPLILVSISYALGLGGLASGAAIAGACAFAMGLATMSMDDNEIGDVIAVALGTPLLQFKNILKHPLIILPPLITSIVTGWLSTVILKLSGTTIGAGMGNMAFAGPLSIVSVMGNSYWLMVIVVDMLLPIVMCYSIYRAFRKLGWINGGDLNIHRL